MTNRTDHIKIIVNTLSDRRTKGTSRWSDISRFLQKDLERLGISINIIAPTPIQGGYRVTFNNNHDLHLALLSGIIYANNDYEDNLRTYTYVKN